MINSADRNWQKELVNIKESFLSKTGFMQKHIFLKIWDNYGLTVTLYGRSKLKREYMGMGREWVWERERERERERETS